MNEPLILGAILVASWVALMYLRVPSSVAFLSVLIGQLLASQANDDVYGFIGQITGVSNEYVHVALLGLPLALTILFMRNHVSLAKRMVEAVPILLVAALTIVLLGPQIPELAALLDSASGGNTEAYKSIIVIAASIAALLSAWLSYPKPGHGKEHHGKKK